MQSSKLSNLASFILIAFSWDHSGDGVDGYYFYSGRDPYAMAKIAKIEGAENKTFSYDFQDAEALYFGVSAYNKLGESAINATGKNGKLVKFGQPKKATNLKGSEGAGK
jgi:hypothetical protein